MNFWKHKKIIFGVLAVVVFAAILAPESLVAESSVDTGENIGVLAFIGGSVVGWALSYVAGLIDFAIKLSYEIFKLDAVTVGWKIMLNFTNLGFVLGIIVIAFATILRVESYGMKQILWKLVVAALLVNFSLVIAGAFISVSNTVSNVFLEATTADSLSNALANAMQPQKFLEVKSEDPSIWNFITGGLDAVIKFFTSLLFILIFTLLTILAFLTLFVMLLTRIIFLIFLLIVSPVVWLLWIFPHTQKYWQQWWSEFIRWNIFAPAVLFFVYLTVITAKNLNQLSVNSGAASKSANLEAANAGILLKNGAIQHGMNLLILLGILYGGIYAANKFGIAGGSIGVSLAEKAGKGVGAWAGRKGKQYSTGWLNKKRGEPGKEKSYADRMSEWSAKSKLAKYTVLPGLAARGVAKFSAAGGENLVKDAKGAASKRSLNENLAMLGYVDAPNRQGILQHLQEKDLLDKVPDASKYISKGYKAEAARFGQSVGYNNIEKSLGMNVGMKEAFDEFGKDSEEFKEAGKKFFSGFSEKDWAKPQYNEIYKDRPSHGVSGELHSARQEIFVASLAEINPGQLAKTMSKIKGTNFDNYEKVVNKVVTKMHETNPEKAKKVAESFRKALGRRNLGIEWESVEFAEVVESKEEKSKEEKK